MQSAHRHRVYGPLAAIALAASMLASIGVARADSEPVFMIDSTGELARLCATGQDNALFSAAIHMCHGYILGIHHFHTALASDLGEAFYCVPTGDDAPSRNDAAAAFVGWVAENPAVADTEAIAGLLTFASEAYPCAAN